MHVRIMTTGATSYMVATDFDQSASSASVSFSDTIRPYFGSISQKNICALKAKTKHHPLLHPPWERRRSKTFSNHLEKLTKKPNCASDTAGQSRIPGIRKTISKTSAREGYGMATASRIKVSCSVLLVSMRIPGCIEIEKWKLKCHWAAATD
jgi:hypothetical protein